MMALQQPGSWSDDYFYSKTMQDTCMKAATIVSLLILCLATPCVKAGKWNKETKLQKQRSPVCFLSKNDGNLLIIIFLPVNKIP
jgi:hypothetical protein